MSQKMEAPPCLDGLTPRQVQVLNTITDFQSRFCYSPTIGELADRLDISRTTAFEHIEQLRKKGLISPPAGKARSLTPSSKARKLLSRLTNQQAGDTEEVPGGIPLVGRVAAGLPVEAVENKQFLSVESCFGNRGDIFALEVRGDSMVGDDIHEGDYVICKRTATAVDGQLVVAIVDDDNATLKRFYKEQTRVRLQPANDAYEPIFSDNCRIEGVVIGLVRKL
jgi:repressor LexA